MGNIPLSSGLGISMVIFGTLISVIAMRTLHPNITANGDFTGQIVTVAVGVCSAAIGMLVHGANLDFDPAMRSFTFAFVGANIAIGWRVWAGAEGNWLDFVPILAIVIVSGLILGLLTSEGDVQRETRERWRREAQSKLNPDSKNDGKKSDK